MKTTSALAKRRRFLSHAAITACLWSVVVVPGPVLAEAPPFAPGERMTYQIRWSFIPAAEAILETVGDDSIDGVSARHFVLTARTYPAIELIYPFQERVDSFTDQTLDRSLRYTKWQEGRTRRDVVVSFDWIKNEAQYTNFGQKNDPIPLLPRTLDPLSGVYFLRTIPLGHHPESLERPVTDGKKNVMGKATIHGRETLTINGTTYDTVKIEPDLKHVKGVFEKSRNAKMFVWITVDARRLVVRLESEVIVGSFVADLIDYRPADPS